MRLKSRDGTKLHIDKVFEEQVYLGLHYSIVLKLILKHGKICYLHFPYLQYFTAVRMIIFR